MKTKLDTITVERDVLLNLCNAAERYHPASRHGCFNTYRVSNHKANI